MSHIARHPKPPLTTTVLPQTTTKKFYSKRQIFLKTTRIFILKTTTQTTRTTFAYDATASTDSLWINKKFSASRVWRCIVLVVWVVVNKKLLLSLALKTLVVKKTRFTLNAVVYSGLHVNVNPYFLQKYNIIVCLVCTSYTFAIVYVGFNLKKQARDGPYYN